MGAVANMRPDLWAGVIAGCPSSTCSTPCSTTPCRSPRRNGPNGATRSTGKADYDRIAGYAPYEQVDAKDYPPIFALAGLTDPRVTYWEPAKWVAKLRATKTGDAPALPQDPHGRRARRRVRPLRPAQGDGPRAMPLRCSRLVWRLVLPNGVVGAHTAKGPISSAPTATCGPDKSISSERSSWLTHPSRACPTPMTPSGPTCRRRRWSSTTTSTTRPTSPTATSCSKARASKC